MEITSVENSESSLISSTNVDHHSENLTIVDQHSEDLTNVDHHSENLVPSLLNHRDVEPKQEVTEEEIRSILEVIASTGKFWHDWEMLKSLLSFRLKQILAEYPESQMANDIGPQPQQSSLSGETYSELVKRLDEALLSFMEGPPFTLQRLCEILLTPRSIYPNLSKLALALEKNLLVTSTLTICTDPYPSTAIQNPVEPRSEEAQAHSNPIQNGIETKADNGDEEMAEAEVEADSDNKSTEMDIMIEENVSETSTASAEPTTISDPSSQPSLSPPNADKPINIVNSKI
ncbi:serine/threonine-protein phosphatase 4 regulatory subunit-like protein [Tasmannia lanceolata]|uniref:serine/threonine-protein phosphatase 4 regulatory subunit-like protein n=1 Tax=Tasmannia lanceolata TaxID=3420 RepID=UPI0040647CB8